MALSFGTDGVRAKAYDELTIDDVVLLARAAARALQGDRVIIGTDTRESGPDFVAALARGFAAEGVHPETLGVGPTPAIAWVARTQNIPGAVVSASHNPWYDNGIKFFAAGGRKLTDEQQTTLEGLLKTIDPADDLPDVEPELRPELLAGYGDAVLASAEGWDVQPLKVVIDCANGASSLVAPDVLRRLGLDVVAIHTQPDGRNINQDCGSTHMDSLSDAVVAHQAALGLAFDGDADRVLAVDSAGRFVDGDHIIGICAHDLRDRGLLTDDTVVVTVMTNLGFRLAMADAGIAVHETGVGDRHVLAALEANRWSLGGEQSGHVIFHDLAGTGDGLLTAVQFIGAVMRSGLPLDQLAKQTMTQLPQVLENVRISGPTAPMMSALAADIAAVEAELGETGRVLVRPSGTEPLIRVMVEAATAQDAQAAVDRLVTAVSALD